MFQVLHSLNEFCNHEFQFGACHVKKWACIVTLTNFELVTIRLYHFYLLMVKIFNTRKVSTTKDKLNVLFCTYNSLSDFTRKRNGPAFVAR